MVRRRLTRSPINSFFRVKTSRETTGIGSTRLSTTWLMIRAWVGLTPQAMITSVGSIVTSRRSQTGIEKPTKPCMMTWPAMVPTAELESPEASRLIRKTAAAPPPRSGVSVR